MQDDFYYQKHGIKFISICPGFTNTTLLTDCLHEESEGKLGEKAPISVYKKMTLQRYIFLYVKPILLFWNDISFSAESVGNCVANILAMDKNGSIWIIDDGKFEEITLTKYWNK